MSSSGTDSNSDNEVEVVGGNTGGSAKTERSSGQQPNIFKCPSIIMSTYAKGPFNKDKPLL